MQNDIELQLLLKLNDRMSRGLKAALNAAQGESRKLKKDVMGIAVELNKIKPTSINRFTEALNKAKSSANQTLSILQKISKLGGATVAAGYVLKTAANKPAQYDTLVRYASNNTFDPASRAIGNARINDSVRNAQRAAQGMGSQEELVLALNKLVGSGAFGKSKEAFAAADNLLGGLNKVAVGSDTSIVDLADLAISAKQNLNLENKEIIPFISKGVVSGKEGGFEIKDQVKYLSEQMAKYTEKGMRGGKGHFYYWVWSRY